MGAEVVGQLFDYEVGHVWAHLQGEKYMRAKLLISIGKSAYFDYKVMDSGTIEYTYPQLQIQKVAVRPGSPEFDTK